MPIYMNIDGIPGDSTAKGFEKQIEVLSFSWGVTNQVVTGGGGGGSTGRASFQDLHFTQKTQSSSPKLLGACASGQHIKEATITFLKKGTDNPQAFLQIKMTDVLVSSFQTAGAEGSDNDVPTDEVSLNFAKFEYDFTSQNPDGSIGTLIPFPFDIKANQ
jgi:type VI secretion system secreted protein Hcp